MPPTEQPTLFLSHGSPPTSCADELGRTWDALALRSPRPAAVLVVSSDWCTRLPVLSGSYCGRSASQVLPSVLRQASPGDSALARRAKELLKGGGIAAGIDGGRRLEHGALEAMRRLFPEPDVPVLQLSIQPDRCARHHHAVGSAIASLRRENILIVGLGRISPNVADCDHFAGGLPELQIGAFRAWAHARLMGGAHADLFDWRHAAPGAGALHPTPQHFLPLFVVLGAAGADACAEWLGGSGTTPPADNYLFASN